MAEHRADFCEPNGTRRECVCPCELCLRNRCREAVRAADTALVPQTCHYCRKQMIAKDATRDHIVPVSAGGDFASWNTVPACRRCNETKAADVGVCFCERCTVAIEAFLAIGWPWIVVSRPTVRREAYDRARQDLLVKLGRAA